VETPRKFITMSYNIICVGNIGKKVRHLGQVGVTFSLVWKILSHLTANKACVMSAVKMFLRQNKAKEMRH
jgi:hypothetical protein